MRILTGATECDAVVFDMDGVLIDTRRSFTECVLRTASLCAIPPGLSAGWDATHVEELRLCGGFNDDCDAAAALALEGREATPGAPWTKVCRELLECGGGPNSVIRRRGEDPGASCWRSSDPSSSGYTRVRERRKSTASLQRKDRASARTKSPWCLATSSRRLVRTGRSSPGDRREKPPWECASSVPGFPASG